jgi:hypothetical protein
VLKQLANIILIAISFVYLDEPTIAVFQEEGLNKVNFKALTIDNKPIVGQKLNIAQLAYLQRRYEQINAYLDSNSEFIITTVKTDRKGEFFLNFDEIRARDIVIQPTWGYNEIVISRSEGDTSTYSDFHIMIYERWNRKKVIYDLRNKTAQIFPEDGEIKTVEFDRIELRFEKNETMDLIQWAADSRSEIELGEYGPFNILIELGDEAAVYMFQWLKLHAPKGDGMIKIGEPGYKYILEALSLTTFREAEDLICRSSFIDKNTKRKYLKHLQIWESSERLENLINSWNDDCINRKWILFRLSGFMDSRATEFLRKVMNDSVELDLRMTAKKALECIQNPGSHMEYRIYKFEEKLKLEPVQQVYQLGEPIEIKCEIVGGTYGSRHLVEFDNPRWHFLPWGVKEKEEITVYRFRIYVNYDAGLMKEIAEEILTDMYPEPNDTYYELLEEIKRGGYAKYVDPDGGIELAYVELKDINKAFRDFQPLEDYITIYDLGEQQEFILEPGEKREYIIDLNDGFLIDLPGSVIAWIGLVEGNKMTVCSKKVTFKIVENNKNNLQLLTKPSENN